MRVKISGHDSYRLPDVSRILAVNRKNIVNFLKMMNVTSLVNIDFLLLWLQCSFRCVVLLTHSVQAM